MPAVAGEFVATIASAAVARVVVVVHGCSVEARSANLQTLSLSLSLSLSLVSRILSLSLPQVFADAV